MCGDGLGWMSDIGSKTLSSSTGCKLEAWSVKGVPADAPAAACDYRCQELLCFVPCLTAQHSTAQHSTAQHSTASHSTAQQQKDKARTDRQKSQTISVRADKGPRSLGCFAETMTYAACPVQGTWGCWVREACRAGACWPLQHCSPDASMKSSAASP